METHEIVSGISWVAPDGQFLMHNAGTKADLSFWPADDIQRLEREGAIKRLPDPPPAPAAQPGKKGRTADKDIPE